MTEVKDLLRDPLKSSSGYQPGGKKLVMSDDVKTVIQLNANENQLGPSPKAVEAMQEAAKISHLYPFTFDQMGKVRSFIADQYDVDPENLMITSGSSGIISAFGEIFLNPGDEVVTCVPTYDSYRAVTSRYGAVYKTAPLKDYTFDLDAMADLITEKTKLIIIVNPNNPTGTLIANEDLDAFMEKVPDHVITVIDEAYFEWIGHPDYESSIKYVKAGKKVAVLKTFSKLYGMAGVRIGYGIMHKDICQAMRTVEFNYGVSRIGLAGAMAAMSDTDYKQRSLENNTKGRDFLMKVLLEVGFEPVPSYANFIYFVPKGISAEDLVSELAYHGVMIRQFGEFGRVSIGLDWQNQLFADTLRQIMTNH